MVQKYQSPVRVYKHPFELVMAVSVFIFTLETPPVHMYFVCNRCSYAMYAGGCFKGLELVTELCTLHVSSSEIENACSLFCVTVFKKPMINCNDKL